MHATHVEIMRFLRKDLGPDIQTFVEHLCDLILAFSGGYSESSFWAKGTAEWATKDQWSFWAGEREVTIYRWLLGDTPIITRHYETHGTIPENFEPFEEFVRRIGCTLLLPTQQFID